MQEPVVGIRLIFSLQVLADWEVQILETPGKGRFCMGNGADGGRGAGKVTQAAWGRDLPPRFARAVLDLELMK